jgi:L-asparaginase II
MNTNGGHDVLDRMGRLSSEPAAGPATVANPVMVQLLRGSHIEAQHRGVALVLEAGKPIVEIGDASQEIVPRSLIKPILATAIVASGTASALSLSPAELALAASSHFGQAQHLDVLSAWCARIGVDLQDIKCGPHKPFDEATAEELIRRREAANVLHNNNSGKHLGAVSMARHLGAPIDTYMAFDHPVQQEYRRAIEIFTGWRCSRERAAIDACRMPTEPIPVERLALGYARLIAPTDIPEPYRSAAATVLDAIRSCPEMMSGPGKPSTVLMDVSGGELIVKAGSEGGYAAIAPNRGFAVVLKIDDGAHRACAAVLLELLHHVGALRRNEYEVAKKKFPQSLRTPDGKTITGEMRVLL